MSISNSLNGIDIIVLICIITAKQPETPDSVLQYGQPRIDSINRDIKGVASQS